jgi:hypothetical protein
MLACVREGSTILRNVLTQRQGVTFSRGMYGYLSALKCIGKLCAAPLAARGTDQILCHNVIQQ